MYEAAQYLWVLSVQLASCHSSSWGSFAEVNRAERKAGHSSTSRAKVVNERSYASTPSIYLYGVNRYNVYVYEVEAVGNVRLVGAPGENRTGNIYNISRFETKCSVNHNNSPKASSFPPILTASSLPVVNTETGFGLCTGCCRFLLHFTLTAVNPSWPMCLQSPSLSANHHLHLSEAYATESQLILSRLMYPY